MSTLIAAHSTGAFELPFALFGISVSGILKTIARLLFSVLAGALLPGWLRHAPGDALRWLIALPDPAVASQWPSMHRLEQDTTAVAVALLPLTFAVAVLRYTASGITGGAHHPAESIGRLVAAAAGLLVLPWAFANAVAAVNVTTNALLSFHAVSEGLTRALALMFAGGIAFGVTGPVVALLVIGAILLAVGLVIIKVGVLAMFAVLYVAGPLALAISPVPELHGAWRAWLGVLTALALIPIGWCLIFAVAGALSADITHIGTPAAIGTRLVGFFAGVLTFFIAFRWPFFLIAMVRSRGLLSGEMIGTRAAGTSAAAGPAGERVRQARQALSAGAGAFGATVSQVGGALGMPRGGLAGAGARATGRAARTAARTAAGTPLALRGRQGLASSWQAVRTRAQGGSRLSSAAGRLREAGLVAVAGPAAVRAAVAERGSPTAARAAAAQVLAEARSDHQPPPAATGGNTTRAAASPPASPPPRPSTSPAPASRTSSRAAVDAAATAAAAQTAARADRPHGTEAAKPMNPPAGPPPTLQATSRPLETPPPAKSADPRPGPGGQAAPKPPSPKPAPRAQRQRPQPSSPSAPHGKPHRRQPPPPPSKPKPRQQRQSKRKGRGR